MDDLISRHAVIIQLSHNKNKGDEEWELAVENDIQTVWKIPTATVGYTYCANALMKLWMENIITDGQYSSIMDKLNLAFKEDKSQWI